MSKLGPDGRPILRADGKVVKGPEFFAPEIAPILRGAGQTDSSAEGSRTDAAAARGEP